MSMYGCTLVQITRQHLSFVADGIADDQPNHETGEELSDDRRNDKGEDAPREGVKSFVHARAAISKKAVRRTART